MSKYYFYQSEKIHGSLSRLFNIRNNLKESVVGCAECQLFSDDDRIYAVEKNGKIEEIDKNDIEKYQIKTDYEKLDKMTLREAADYVISDTGNRHNYKKAIFAEFTYCDTVYLIAGTGDFNLPFSVIDDYESKEVLRF